MACFATLGSEVSRESTVRAAQELPGGADESSGIRHEAFLYHGDAGFIAATCDFVLKGLAAGEAVMVAVRQPRIRQLRVVLGSAADRVSFVDMTDLGRNPARIIPAWQDFLDDTRERGQRARGVGEPMWPGRGGPEQSECLLHETLLNAAFAASPAWRLRCPYDVERLERTVVDGVWRTHPVVVDHGFGQASTRYRAAGAIGAIGAVVPRGAEIADPLAAALPDLGVPQLELAFAADGLGRVRAAVTGAAQARGIAADRVDELELAVHEIATNSVRHGGGAGLLRIWIDAATLICEVRDRGRVFDQLAGRRRPDLSAGGGRGLWLVNQLCDLVQLRSNRFGTVVRMYVNP